MGQWLHNMVRIVGELLRQGDDQLEIGIPQMEVHILPLDTDWAINLECKCRGVSPLFMSLNVRIWRANH